MAGSLAALSPGQVTFFFVYGWTLCLWLLAEFLHWKRPQYESVNGSDMEMSVEKGKEGERAVQSGSGTSHEPSSAAVRPANWATLAVDCMSCDLIRCMLFDAEAVKANRNTLRHMSEFGSLMVWYYICDRTSVMPSGEKTYSRDLFAFLFLILTCVAFGSSLQTVKVPTLLSRQQTEEWKGWMQVLFLLYHYFEAKEMYNAIRIFIAGYVWMTGFGNFSYYYKTGDYCIGRFSQMMWRLNFLVFVACLVMRNSYMLYYICPMHTIFTVLVYACLGIAPHWNSNNALLTLKMLLCFAVVFVCWDIQAVFYAIWKPFTWLVGYQDPRKEAGDEMYEWFFRSGLDRYVWIYGMLCAWAHPHAAAFLSFVDSLTSTSRAVVRSAVLSTTLVAGYFWYAHIYTLPKIEYNAVHPFTSWIPITLFIVLRNFTPSLRLHHMRLFGWLGCITLETYIGQFHIWLKTDIADGQPKALLNLLPGYPLLNFAVVTAGYVFVSYRLFQLTNDLKNVAVPHSNNAVLLRNVLVMGAVGAGLYFSTYAMLMMFVY